MSIDDDKYSGYSARNPFGRRYSGADGSLGAANETPVDLTAVQADDALLDMLGGNATGRSEADAELARVLVVARVLVAWRRDVDTEPISEPVDTDAAMAMLAGVDPPPPSAWSTALIWMLVPVGGVVLWALAFWLLLLALR